jgi:hypothetical protein
MRHLTVAARGATHTVNAFVDTNGHRRDCFNVYTA